MCHGEFLARILHRRRGRFGVHIFAVGIGNCQVKNALRDSQKYFEQGDDKSESAYILKKCRFDFLDRSLHSDWFTTRLRAESSNFNPIHFFLVDVGS